MAVAPLYKYIESANYVGVPADQIENFVKAGIVLQPRQLQASAAARECDVKGGPVQIGYGGARGGGKTFWSLAQIAADDCQRYPGVKALWLRKVGKAAEEGFEDLRAGVLGNIPHKYTKGKVHFPNGSRIVIGHFHSEGDIDQYLGLEYDIIGIEEYTTLSASKLRRIASCNRSSKPGWRPRRYCTTNPGGVSHALFKQRFIMPFRRNEEGKTRFIPATFRDNAFLNEEYVDNLNELVGWELKAWRDGDWDIAAGQFFTQWRDDTHVIKNLDVVPQGWTVWVALDYGFTHYTAAGVLCESGDGEVILLDEIGYRKSHVETIAQAIKSSVDRLGLEFWQLDRCVAGADVFAQRGAKGGETIASQYAEHGIDLRPAKMDRINGAAAINKRLGDSDNGIAPSLFICERCVKTIATIPEMVHDENRPEDVLKVDCDEDGNGGDDFYDMVRYGIMEARTNAISSFSVIQSEEQRQVRDYKPR